MEDNFVQKIQKELEQIALSEVEGYIKRARLILTSMNFDKTDLIEVAKMIQTEEHEILDYFQKEYKDAIIQKIINLKEGK